MAKPPKTDSDKIPQIDDAEVKAAQERLKARIEDSKKRDEARKPSERATGKKTGKPAAKAKPVKAPRPPNSKSAKSGTGLGTVLMCSLIAAGIGGAVGWLGPQYFGASKEGASIAQLEARVVAAEAQIKSQEQNFASANSDISRLSELDAMQAQMNEMSGAVNDNTAAIETAATQREEFAARLDVTDAASGEDVDGRPNAVLERIDAMEMKVTELAAQPDLILERVNAIETKMADSAAAPAPSNGTVITEPSVISYETNAAKQTVDVKDGTDGGNGNSAVIDEGDAADADGKEVTTNDSQGTQTSVTATPPASAATVSPPQSAPQTPAVSQPASTPAPAPAPSNYDFVGNFPAAAMLAAVKSEPAPTESKNWFQRQLDRHVQSGASEAENARRDIILAEQLAQRGDISGAADLINRQSPAVKDAARAWLAAADAQN